MCLTHVVQVLGTESGMATVDHDGRCEYVVLTALGDDASSVRAGDWLLVHCGLATHRVDEAEAIAIREGMGS